MALTAQQLEQRRSLITASDIPAILGICPWGSPSSVFATKVLGKESDEQTYRMEKGHAVEPLLISWAGRKRESKTVHNTETFAGMLPAFPWAGATPDGFEMRLGKRAAALDAKIVGRWVASKWFDDLGEKQVPDYVHCQVQWQMSVMRLPTAIVVADFDEREPEVFEIAHDDELAGCIFEEANRFWVDHIVKQVPPPVDGSRDSVELVKRLFPSEKHNSFIQASPGMEEIARALVDAKMRLAQAEAEIEAAENNIKAKIGLASGMEGFGWRATWTTERGHVSYKDALKELCPNISPDDLEQFRGNRIRKFRFKAQTKSSTKKVRLEQ